MKERWGDATWLGKRKSSDEHICCLLDGTILYTASIRVREDKWNFEKFNTVRGTPWNLTGKQDGEVITPEVIPFTQPEIDEAISAEPDADAGAIPEIFRSPMF